MNQSRTCIAVMLGVLSGGIRIVAWLFSAKAVVPRDKTLSAPESCPSTLVCSC